MAKIFIPNELYVTVQYRGSDTNNEEGLLGFASPYTKDAAFEKRKLTQDEWALPGATITIGNNNTVTVIPPAVNNHNSYNRNWTLDKLVDSKCHPFIMKNDLAEGFEIAKSVRRYGWGGSGNVKWRITDPRGFDLEISSENFAKIIDCSTIENGIIKGRCCWGRQGSANVLLPESSDPYKEALSLTRKTGNLVPLKAVKIGDVVEVLNDIAQSNKAIYLGSYNIIIHDTDNYNYNSYIKIANIQRERYLFEDTNNNTIFALSTPKIASVIKSSKNVLTKEDMSARINLYLQKYDNDIDGLSGVVFVSNSKVDLKDIKVDFLPDDFKFNGNFPGKEQAFSNNPLFFLKDKQDKYWVGKNKKEYINGVYISSPTLIMINRIDENTFCHEMEIPVSSNRWNAFSSRIKTMPADNINPLEQFYILVVKYKNVVYKVYRTGYYL
jgi:hypothetical protein